MQLDKIGGTDRYYFGQPLDLLRTLDDAKFAFLVEQRVSHAFHLVRDETVDVAGNSFHFCLCFAKGRYHLFFQKGTTFEREACVHPEPPVHLCLEHYLSRHITAISGFVVFFFF
jgi:hypothetical protein